MKFLKCSLCGDTVIAQENNLFSCCNVEMQKVMANKTEAATEKHIPVVNIKENNATIAVGEIPHPMTEEHYIEWIALEFEDGIIKMFDLKPNQEPVVTYKAEKKVKSAYAYCNLHGLWKTEV